MGSLVCRATHGAFHANRYNQLMLDRYEPKEFEAKWRQKWEEADLFKTREEEGREKFYGLDFFPYPSGAGLSVGHCRNYVPTDVLCRMRYMQGYNVLHPMGFDAFGLPAENEAIKNKTHPAPMIDRYAATYKRQMDLVGISYDWSRSFKSCDPDYYKWTQWIFGLLYKRGLAYRRDAEVNWCPKDKTALANEEVVAGHCERCGTPVEKRKIPQWFFRITEYAQRLIDDLDELDWPEGIKNQQRNWIGRSEGVQFRMDVVFDPDSPSTSKITDGTIAPPANTDSELESLKAEVQAEGGGVPDESQLQRSSAMSELIQKTAADIDATVWNPARDMFESAKEKVRAVSQSSELEFVVKAPGPQFEVFTTRIDTIFGVTFCVLAPEHPLVARLTGHVPPERARLIADYQAAVKGESDLNRLAEGREKTGVFTGAYAVNPVTQQTIPIWVADYVLMGYGTGAIMAVPAGDQRDFEFATKFDIPVRAIQNPPAEWFESHGRQDYSAALGEYMKDPKAFPNAFVSKSEPLVDAQRFTGMPFDQATEELSKWFESYGYGVRKVNYRLRDWLISRQRYWGCPIPICYDKDGNEMLIPENQLPVELPDVESYEPTDDGSSPLSRINEFVNCTTPEGSLGRRETDTMGGFACSSWYFLRFCDPHNDLLAWDAKKVENWMPVDCYVGGAEHAVMHLLYARFWTKVLYDAGLVPVKEPFHRLKNQGQVLGRTPYRKPNDNEQLDIGEDGVLLSYEDAAKTPETDLTWKWVRMSKSKGNVVTPDEAVETYGADALRVYELFVAPFDSDVEWNNDGMVGAARFLSRVFKLVHEASEAYVPEWRSTIGTTSGSAKEVRRATHKAIKKVTTDIDRFAFNTYISGLMEFVNAINDLKKKGADEDKSQFDLAMSEAVETLTVLVSPAAPHSADELWSYLGKQGFTYQANWPQFDPDLAKDDVVTIAIQVNGKLRDTIEVAADASNEELESSALLSEKVRTYLAELTVRKVIVVKGKLVNVVAN